MVVVIREENGFMPSTIITIKEDSVVVEENNLSRILKYNKEEIGKIIEVLLNIFSDWEEKYIDKKIIDDDIFTISVIENSRKEYYIKNKYPNNWSKFILLRNKLLREEL